MQTSLIMLSMHDFTSNKYSEMPGCNCGCDRGPIFLINVDVTPVYLILL